MRHQREDLKAPVIVPRHIRSTIEERQLQERIRALTLKMPDEIWILDFRNRTIYRPSDR